MPGIDPIDVALPALLNDLSGTDAKQALILDDYHVLTDARIHEGVEYLLSYLPPSLRLVIAGRLDPPQPLARMRARGELIEIRNYVASVTSGRARPDIMTRLLHSAARAPERAGVPEAAWSHRRVTAKATSAHTQSGP